MSATDETSMIAHTARLKLTGSAIALALVCLALADCGVAASAHHSARAAATFDACPRHIQEIQRAPTSHKPVRAVVPLDPIAGGLCVYSADGAKGSPPVLQWSATLSEARARTLTLLLDSRGGRGPSCDAGYPVFMRLRYRGARVLSTLAAGCDPELLSAPTGVELLSPTASLAIAGLLDPPLNHGGRTTRVFDYIGQRLATAALAAKRHLKAAGEAHVSPYERTVPRSRHNPRSELEASLELADPVEEFAYEHGARVVEPEVPA
jgi:hypothetical protein